MHRLSCHHITKKSAVTRHIWSYHSRGNIAKIGGKGKTEIKAVTKRDIINHNLMKKRLHIFWGVRKLPWKSSFSTIYLIPHSAATYQELAEVFLTFVSLLYIMLSVHIYWRKMSLIKAHMNTNKKHANIGPSVNHCTKSYYCCNKNF